MPTFEWQERFRRDFERLTPAQKTAFLRAIERFVEDLRRGDIRPGLRVKQLHGREKVHELTWAPDGRATFEYGPERRPGERHIIWRRIGTHDIFNDP